MPMIDACIPKDALTPVAEQRLLDELTEILLAIEGFEPSSPLARDATWIFVQRPDVFVAGARPARPSYRFIVSVPEGQFEEASRELVVSEVTAAVARAEGVRVDEVSKRVWVFPLEIQDGSWGARGEIQRLPDILAHLAGEDVRWVGERRLADIRRRRSVALLNLIREGSGVKNLIK